MSQNEERAKADLAFARDDWERLVSSLERLMALQRKTLQRLRELNRRNEALSRKPGGTSSTSVSRPKSTPPHRIQITGELSTARVGLVCVCGRELASGAKFCDRCGRSV